MTIKQLNKSEQELLDGSFMVCSGLITKIPSTRRATDMECLREYLHAKNPVTRASCFDIVVSRLKRQHE